MTLSGAGAYILSLLGGATGVNLRRAPNVQGSIIRALRGGAEVRWNGITDDSSTVDSFVWLRVFNGVDAGWIAWMPRYYELTPRPNTIWVTGVVEGDPGIVHVLRNIRGGTERVTTDIHQRGFRVVKNALFQEYERREGRYVFWGDTSPFEQDTVYRAVPAGGVPYWPLWMSEGDSFVVRAADLAFYKRATGELTDIPSPDHRVALRRFYRRWTNPLGRELQNVAEFYLTFLDGTPFETQWYGFDRGLVGFQNHPTGWWSHYDGDAQGGTRPAVSVPGWWPDKIGARTQQPVGPPVVDPVPPAPPVQPEPPEPPAEPPGDEDARRLVWPVFSFDGAPGWEHHEGDRTMVLPAGFEARWMPFAVDGVDTPIPYVFNKGEHYQIKFDWLAGRLDVDVEQALTWAGPGIYTLMFNISKDGPMEQPEMVQWGASFVLPGGETTGGKEVLVPDACFNAKDHSGVIFIPVEIADPADIERVSLVFKVPIAVVSGGEMRVYGFAMWPALAGDAELYPADYEMERVGWGSPVGPPDEPEPDDPPGDDYLELALRQIGQADRLLGLARDNLERLRDKNE